MEDVALDGRCACGSLAFRVSGEPRFVAHCHCENCRRAHGAGLVTFAGYRDEQFEWTGAGRPVAWSAQNGAVRSFCGTCGSTLLYAGPSYPGEVHVAIAAFEGEFPYDPKLHAFASRAPRWCPITDRLPRIPLDDPSELETP